MLLGGERRLSSSDLLALLTKIVTMNHFEAQEFKDRLNEPAKIYSFECGDLVDEVANLQIFSGTANAVETYFNGKHLSERDTQMPVAIVKESGGIFEFTIQNMGGKECHLLTCHVKKKYQGQGKSKDMVKAIKDTCFEHWGYQKIYGRAGIARVDEGVAGKGDWRQVFQEYEGQQIKGLMKFWLSQKDVFPLTDFDKQADKDRFVILPKGS